MKKYIPILLFAIIPLFYSCVSREQANYASVTSAISALANGQNWAAVVSDTLTNDTMLIHAQWKRYILRMKFPISASTFTLTGNNGQYFNTNNAGQIIQTFKLDSNYDNSVTSITNVPVNPRNKYVSGQFKARFVIDPSGINIANSGADTITLTNGKFTATYN